MGFHGRFCILLPLLAKVCRRRQDTTLLRREYVSVSEKDNFPPFRLPSNPPKFHANFHEKKKNFG